MSQQDPFVEDKDPLVEAVGELYRPKLARMLRRRHVGLFLLTVTLLVLAELWQVVEPSSSDDVCWPGLCALVGALCTTLGWIALAGGDPPPSMAWDAKDGWWSGHLKGWIKRCWP